jgi:hypothetical protein
MKLPKTPEAPPDLFAEQLRSSLAAGEAEGDPRPVGAYEVGARVAHHARIVRIWNRHRALGYTKCPCAACSWCLDHHFATTEWPKVQLEGQAPREDHPDGMEPDP